MSVRARARWLAGAALFAASATSLHGQQGTKKLQPTAATESAKSAFRAAFFESQNVSPERARLRIAEAVQADPAFGLAQVYQTVVAAGMTPAQREARIAQQLGSMGTATPAEVLLALYWREAAAGRTASAVPLLRMVTEMVPDDPELAYAYDGTQRFGKSEAEQVAMLRSFLTRFPSHGAAHNQLGYTLWRMGDAEGAMASMQQYVKAAPDHPNAHDSFADILILMGRAAEAAPHVQREIELDPNFGGVYSKLGAIHLTTGDMNGARVQFAQALSRAATPAARIEAMSWQAASHVYARDGRATVQEFMRAAGVAQEANMPGAVVTAHSRAAVVDAYMGDRKAVPAHLTTAEAAATTNGMKANYQAHAAIAHSRTGKKQEAREAAAQFATLAPNNVLSPLLDAILALDAKDYKGAETAVAAVKGQDPLSKAVRAELMMRTGRKSEGQALKSEVLAAAVKMEGNPPIEFLSVVARMRVAGL
jgi:tetratricopeptide (TPR) repeat protein